MLKKALAFIVIVDGITTLFWGPGFLQWARPQRSRPAHPVAKWFLQGPEALLRLGAVGQAVLGWIWLRNY
jgi:hypothetical protein